MKKIRLLILLFNCCLMQWLSAQPLYPVLNNQTKLYGFADRSGNLIIPYKYKSVDYFKEGVVGVKEHRNWGFIDASGKIVVPMIYDEVYQFSEGCAVVRIGKKYSFVDKEGNVLDLKKKFQQLRSFSNGIAPAKLGEYWGYIDKTGKTIIDFDYQAATDFSEDLAAVCNKNCGYIDIKGNWKIKEEFHSVKPFRMGFAAVRKDNKWGYINKKGEFVIEPTFDKASSFYAKATLATVIDDNGKVRIALITIQKNNLQTQLFDDILFTSDIYDPFFPLFLVKNKKITIVDNNGNVLLDNLDEVNLGSYPDVSFFPMWVEKDGLLTQIDSTGKILQPWLKNISLTKQDLNVLRLNFNEGYAKIKVRGLYGLVDTTGKIVIDCNFKALGNFSEGLIAVRTLADKVGFLDNNQKIVIDYFYDDAFDFKEGFVAVKQNGKWGYIDIYGNAATEFIYDSLSVSQEKGIQATAYYTKYDSPYRHVIYTADLKSKKWLNNENEEENTDNSSDTGSFLVGILTAIFWGAFIVFIGYLISGKLKKKIDQSVLNQKLKKHAATAARIDYETEKETKDFETFYYKTLLNQILLAENVRRQKIKLYFLILGFVFLYGYSIFYYIFGFKGFLVFLLIFFPIIFFVFDLTYKKSLVKQINMFYKNNVMKKLIEFVNAEFVYYPNGNIAVKELQDMDFNANFDKINTLISDDIIHGKYNGLFMYMADVNASFLHIYQRKGKTVREQKILFQGLVLNGDLKKTFSKNIYINTQTRDAVNHRGYSRIPIGFTDYDDLMSFYFQNADDATWFAASDIPKHLYDFVFCMKNPCYISLQKKKIYIGVEFNKCLFEPRFYSTLLNYEDYKMYYLMIKRMYNLYSFIVDELQRIDKKTNNKNKKQDDGESE